MSYPSIEAWMQRLELAAARTLGEAGERSARDAGDRAVFADELGHRRAVDVPFLAWRSGQRRAPAAPATASVDVVLWHALMDRGVEIEPIMTPSGGGDAPITSPEAMGTIEVWTETELCSLHAVWRLAKLRDRDDLIARCLGAARWHIEHLQPDNATNHPWAIHVFIIAAQRLGSFEHELHAQAMLHGCQVGLGRPDALSAHILLDAAECLAEEQSS